MRREHNTSPYATYMHKPKPTSWRRIHVISKYPQNHIVRKLSGRGDRDLPRKGNVSKSQGIGGRCTSDRVFACSDGLEERHISDAGTYIGSSTASLVTTSGSIQLKTYSVECMRWKRLRCRIVMSYRCVESARIWPLLYYTVQSDESRGYQGRLRH